jgi:hypothetical protein
MLAKINEAHQHNFFTRFDVVSGVQLRSECAGEKSIKTRLVAVSSRKVAASRGPRAGIPMEEMETAESDFKGKHAARYICARLLPIDLQLFYCSRRVFNSNPRAARRTIAFASVQLFTSSSSRALRSACTYMSIQRGSSLL